MSFQRAKRLVLLVFIHLRRGGQRWEADKLPQTLHTDLFTLLSRLLSHMLFTIRSPVFPRNYFDDEAFCFLKKKKKKEENKQLLFQDEANVRYNMF